MVDGREGIHPVDSELIKGLENLKNFIVCVNKCGFPPKMIFIEEFRKLGCA